MIFASSETTYGIYFADGEVRPEYVPIDEEHPTVPHDSSAISKVVNELTARSFQARSGIDMYGLRINNVIEPHEYASKFPAFVADPVCAVATSSPTSMPATLGLYWSTAASGPTASATRFSTSRTTTRRWAFPVKTCTSVSTLAYLVDATWVITRRSTHMTRPSASSDLLHSIRGVAGSNPYRATNPPSFISAVPTHQGRSDGVTKRTRRRATPGASYSTRCARRQHGDGRGLSWASERRCAAPPERRAAARADGRPHRRRHVPHRGVAEPCSSATAAAVASARLDSTSAPTVP